MSTDQFARDPFFAGITEIRSSWGWFLAFGILLIILGGTCIFYTATATSIAVQVIGWLLMISGVFALLQGIQVHNWKGFFLYLLSALLRGFTGYLLIRYTDSGAAAMTLVLASFFIVGGIFRATGAAMLQFPGWGWASFSGILSFVLGVMLLIQLPTTSLWFIGLFVGIDMIFDGVAFIGLASAIHTLPKITTYKTKPV
jgi:uncharacterized membrane protein HdeD (DUF308 family)